MIISGYQRYCLDLQGYSHLAEQAKRRIDLAQRFKPAVCTALVVLALLTQSVPFTIFLAILGYWAAFFPLHPIDLGYRWVVMPLFNAPDLSMDPPRVVSPVVWPRRFSSSEQ